METNEYVKSKKDQFRIQLRKKKLQKFFEKQRTKSSSQKSNEVSHENQDLNDLTKFYEQAFQDQNIGKLYDYTVLIRREISSGKLITEETQNLSIIPLLVKVLGAWQKIPNNLIAETLHILINIIVSDDGNSTCANYLSDDDKIEIVMELVKHSDHNVSSNALWCVCNFAGGNAQYQHQLLELGLYDIISYLASNIKSSDIEKTKNIAWLMSNITRGDNIQIELIQPFIPFLVGLLKCTVEGVLRDTLWALANICNLSDIATRELLQNDKDNEIILKALEILSGDHDKSLLVPSLRLLGNIVSNDADTVSQHVVDLGLLSVLYKYLKSDHAFIRKETCWLLSNVLCSGKYCVKKTDEQQLIIPELIKMALNENNAIKTEALFCLVNLSNNCGVIMSQKVMKMGIIGPIIQAMGQDNCKTKLLICILKALKNLFYQGTKYETPENLIVQRFHELDGSINLEELQYHKEEKVAKLCVEVIDEYFTSTSQNNDEFLNEFENDDQQNLG